MIYEYMISDKSLLESNTKDDTEIIIVNVAHFYEHVSKFVFNGSKQTISWKRSIFNTSAEIRKMKDTNAYKVFDMKQNFSKINSKTISFLKNEGNDLKQFDLDYIYQEFPTLDSICDINHIIEFLTPYIQNDKIHLP